MLISRSFSNRLLLAIFWSAGLVILLVLTGIIGYLFLRGGSSLTLEFLSTAPKGLPLGTSGGVLPAIRGTLLLVSIAVLAAAAPGLITATYLSEYGDSSKLKFLINITIQCMAGLPSIVTGLFGYAFFVVYLGFGISLLAGGLSLGIMIFPVIVLTARDALLAVNEQYRLAGAALGVSRWYMLHRVIIPQSAPGILSGILLAMGYAAGATAPIMVTAAVISAGMNGGLTDPVMALPYHLYILFSQHISMEKAYGTALLLVLLLLFLNITALLLKGRHRKGGY